MATAPLTRLTEEEYLRLERAATEKSEYHAGEVFAMSGGSDNHSFLATRVVSMLDRQTPAGCRAFNSDLRIKIPSSRRYLYSDGGLICGEAVLTNPERDNLLNPCLIIEVLSPSTASYDRGEKFELYRAIPTFVEYLVIHQDRRLVEHYSKQPDASWVLREYAASATIPIPRYNLEIPLPELYAPTIGIDE